MRQFFCTLVENTKPENHICTTFILWTKPYICSLAFSKIIYYITRHLDRCKSIFDDNFEPFFAIHKSPYETSLSLKQLEWSDQWLFVLVWQDLPFFYFPLVYSTIFKYYSLNKRFFPDETVNAWPWMKRAIKRTN